MQSLLFPEFSPDELEPKGLSDWTDAWLGRLPELAPGDPRLVEQALALRRIDTPLGPMLAVCSSAGLALLEFVDKERIEKQLYRATSVHGGPLLRAPRRRNGFTMLDGVEDQVHAYFAGELAVFELPLAPVGTPFQRAVWKQLAEVPYGAQRSYGEIARAVGRPTAARAVGAANGRNPIAIIQPCHRIVGSDGTLTGYAGGLWRKRRLLELETNQTR
ncbi:Methylated-DNA--protein-cysteine methyltransferase [Planctomycetes bacterium Poly30]|uniref:Methylated-DNA--protein-cysteine methyltransferase n=1 Tax=Saltatorellus ferox TaxID=2528018 RepID=A0A518F112_9BACT|nr:Methylated-DNA--protein-cysteine methyltransferase [Planctomycetes bacterium Poly30]